MGAVREALFNLSISRALSLSCWVTGTSQDFGPPVILVCRGTAVSPSSFLAYPIHTVSHFAPDFLHTNMNGEEYELRIPSVQQDVDIVGILHRKPRTDSSSPRRIALVLHGLLAHKNQCYHRALAQALTIDSYRFDFRGNGDTGGDWTMGNLDNDVRDLATVVRHLHHELGYVVELIVGHSRGSMISWLYLSKEERELQEDGGRGWVPRLVVVSGRWVMANVLKTYARFLEGFQKEGFYKWQITSAGKKREYIVWPNDLDRLTTSKDPKQVVACLSPKTDV